MPTSLPAADTAGEKIELSFCDQHGNTVPRDMLKQLMHTAPPLSVGRLSLLGQEQQPGAGAGTMRWLCGQQEKAVLPADAWQLHADRAVLVLTDTAILGPVPWGRKKQNRCASAPLTVWLVARNFASVQCNPSHLCKPSDTPPWCTLCVHRARSSSLGILLSMACSLVVLGAVPSLAHVLLDNKAFSAQS
jgi:hypothetical protein